MWVDRDKSSWFATVGRWLLEGNWSARCWWVAQSDSKVSFLEKSVARSNVFLTSVIWLYSECSVWVIGFFFDLGMLAGSLSTLEDSFLTPWNTISQTWITSRAGRPTVFRRCLWQWHPSSKKSVLLEFPSALYKNVSAEARGFSLLPRLFNRNLGSIKSFYFWTLASMFSKVKAWLCHRSQRQDSSAGTWGGCVGGWGDVGRGQLHSKVFWEETRVLIHGGYVILITKQNIFFVEIMK